MRCTVLVIVILSVRPSVRLSVRLSHSYTVSTWFDLRSWFLHHMVNPIILVSGDITLIPKFEGGSPWARALNEGGVGTNWRFLTNKSPYLRNGARYDKGYYWSLLGSRIRAFDWYKNQRPWLTLKWLWTAIMHSVALTHVFRSQPLKFAWT